jgi:hypothetical protein
MRLITDATPESADSLPSSPSSFFSYYATAKSSLSSTLQHTLSMQAASSQYEACQRNEEARWWSIVGALEGLLGSKSIDVEEYCAHWPTADAD